MSQPFIHPLEDRKYLAAEALDVAPIDVVNPRPPVIAVQQQSGRTDIPNKKKKASGKNAAKVKKPANAEVRSINLVGEWEGRSEQDFGFYDIEYDFDLSVYEQNLDSIYARVEIDDYEFEGWFFGKINAKNGRFRFTMDDDGDEVTLKGQLSKKGKVIGGGKVDVESWDCCWGWDFEGTFQVDRIA